MEGLRTMHGGIPSIACYMGIKRPRPPDIRKDACWSFMNIFRNFLSERFYCFRMDLIVLQISCDFFKGSWMI